MSNTPKPVTVLSGFLGAGKTTVLNAILSHKNTIRFAIIENEVGEIGIDGDLIVKNTDSFTELNNGCICCSINTNFVDTLRELSKRSDWDELIIEATGVANPAGIIAPFKQFPWIQKYFEIPQVICVADAQNINEQLQASETAASQLAYGDNIYISKSDLVDEEQYQETKKTVQGLNPFAKIFKGTKSEVPVEEIMQRRKSALPIISFAAPVPKQEVKLKHDNYDAIALEYDEAFDENKLYARLYTFLLIQAKDVYRFKGIFHDPRKPNKMVIQSVMQSIYIEEGEEWIEEEKKSRFVFIGKNLVEKGFDKMLRACLFKEV